MNINSLDDERTWDLIQHAGVVLDNNVWRCQVTFLLELTGELIIDLFDVVLNGAPTFILTDSLLHFCDNLCAFQVKSF